MRGLAFDVVLLDVMMPGENGLELARELKAANRDIPICMLTARAEPEHRIEGLEIGVDDYVPKPFEPRELLLRLRNILRRGQTLALPLSRRDPHGQLRVPCRRGELKRDDETIKLTERERDLLRLFAQSAACRSRATSLAAATNSPAANAPSTCRSTVCGARSRPTPPTPSISRQCVAKGYILYTD